MIKSKTKHVVSLDDLDTLVSRVYGKPYSFQQQDGCKERGTFNLTVPNPGYTEDYEANSIPDVINGDEMGVSFAAWLARDVKQWNGKPEDKTYLNMFWERNFYPDVQMIANDLHEKGFWPAGDYVIEIDW